MVLILFRHKGLFRPAIRLLGLPEIRWRFFAAMTALLLSAIALPDGLTKEFTLLLLLYIVLAFYIAETISRNRRRPRVVIKVRKSLPRGRISNRRMRRIFPSWSRITAATGRVKGSRMFKDAELKRLDEHISRAIRLDVTYRPANFGNYLLVQGKVNADLTGLVAGLSDIPEVESVYLDPFTDAAADPSDDPRYPYQFYLRSAPEGVDAEYAWTMPGGAGEGTTFIDVEEGWNLKNSDLQSAANAPLISGPLEGDGTINPDHGTQVLGVVMAQDNTVGCIGIAHRVGTAKVLGFRAADGDETRARAIAHAVTYLQAGDVMVLPIQTIGPNAKLPVEIAQLDFDGIRSATAGGIIVVEAAGNQGTDLDAWRAANYRVLDPTHPAFEDSGSIMVGGGDSTAFAPASQNDGSINDGLRLTQQLDPGRHRRGSTNTGSDANSNFGARVDCYAWGEKVVALMPGNFFNGSSSATAILAGVVLSIQGVVKNLGRPPLGARQLRQLLKYQATPSFNPAVDKIGVMPDLRAIINFLHNPSHLYLRDAINDAGTAHSIRFAFCSPDIIVRQQAVQNAQAALGAGSGTESDAFLSEGQAAGVAHSVYVRVRNSGVTAGAAKIFLYATGAATIPGPTSLTPITAAAIAPVPAGNQLVVCGPYAWTPATAACGLLVTLETADNPAVQPRDLANVKNVSRFIRAQENLAVRNEHIVDATAVAEPANPVSQSHIALPFDAPPIETGSSGNGSIQLDLYSDLFRLPAPQPLLWLEAPSAFGQGLPAGSVAKDDGQHCWISIASNRTFPAVPLQGLNRQSFRVLIQIPGQHQAGTYRVEVQQLDGTELAGAIAWTLVPSN